MFGSSWIGSGWHGSWRRAPRTRRSGARWGARRRRSRTGRRSTGSSPLMRGGMAREGRWTRTRCWPWPRRARPCVRWPRRWSAARRRSGYWLKRVGQESPAAKRWHEGAIAMASGAREAILSCREHGPVRHVRHENGFRCAECRSAAVSARRRRVKATLLAEAGGRCRLCGYDRCVAALHFHHVDPETKSFSLAVTGVTRSLAAARAEARKCVVLCANCHAEVESGLVDVSIRSGESGFAG